ncbi:MAG: hypothetical protein V4487_03605 [Chlamydiota bacterium]
MDDKKYKGYIADFVSILKKQALEAKQDADKPKKGYEDFNQGHLMAYHAVFSLLKHEAFVLNINEKELGLADIDPDADLLGLHKRNDIDL